MEVAQGFDELGHPILDLRAREQDARFSRTLDLRHVPSRYALAPQGAHRAQTLASDSTGGCQGNGQGPGIGGRRRHSRP